ncbi:hypothetical protein, partial [Novacetimonas hansenii]|uniref:hypothetical protein n=1 Tax=Novacetimonas hansenii TaxID=436 RepID=UPI001C376B1D
TVNQIAKSQKLPAKHINQRFFDPSNSRFIDPNAFPDPFFPIVCPYCSTTSSHADVPRVVTPD